VLYGGRQGSTTHLNRTREGLITEPVLSILANCYNGVLRWFRNSARSAKKPSCAQCRAAVTLLSLCSPVALIAAPVDLPLSLHIARITRRSLPLVWVIHGRFPCAHSRTAWYALLPSALVSSRLARGLMGSHACVTWLA
jgi:hypothetical protein